MIVDWKNENVIAVKKLAQPYGFHVEGSRFWAACWKYNDLMLWEGSRLVKVLTHPLWNHIHTVDASPFNKGQTMLLTSSSTDLIAEIAADGETLWQWFAFEHGYDTLKSGEKLTNFDKSFDYRHSWSPTARQTTHVNAAIYLDQDHILATIPTVGHLIKIDKKTGKSQILLDQLAFPHSIRRRNKNLAHRDGFLLCNTLAREVLVLDKNLKKQASIPVPSLQPFVQDCIEVSSGSFVVLSNRKLPLDDDTPEDPNDTNVVAEVDSAGNVAKELVVNKDNRLYFVEELSEADANFWVNSWKDETAKVLPELINFDWKHNEHRAVAGQVQKKQKLDK